MALARWLAKWNVYLRLEARGRHYLWPIYETAAPRATTKQPWSLPCIIKRRYLAIFSAPYKPSSGDLENRVKLHSRSRLNYKIDYYESLARHLAAKVIPIREITWRKAVASRSWATAYLAAGYGRRAAAGFAKPTVVMQGAPLPTLDPFDSSLAGRKSGTAAVERPSAPATHDLACAGACPLLQRLGFDSQIFSACLNTSS